MWGAAEARGDFSALGYPAAKRLFDIAAALLALAALSPLMLLIAGAVKLDSRGPVFYVSERCGKDQRVFRMYKFRSMCADAEARQAELADRNEADGPAFKIKEDPRVTRVGRVIRRFSMDELPQLLNIVRGDMSLVGPRPPLPSEVAQYTEHQLGRLAVRPGLTCYWQCAGCSHASFDRWVELDLKYIRERGFWLDLKIILRTIPMVLLGDRA